jgi:probable F420-dependent oxidoreductase
VRLGLSIFPTDETPSPADLGRMAQERGFESLFFPEHTHIPASRATPHPAGIDLPREYARLLDPLIACTAAAGATSTLRVGTAVCLVAQHDPIVLAKQVASADLVSGGRLVFGVGAGWNVEEMRHHGTEPEERFAIVRERVEAMREIWTHEEATYHGKHVRFDRVWSWPKPVQRPHPPVLVGGNGPRVLERVLAYGDGWMPNREAQDEPLLARVADLRERAAAAGRAVEVTVNNASTAPERLDLLERAGIERAVFHLPAAGADAVEARLERIEAGVRSLRGG